MSHVILQKGFRPFFLLGGILGCCLVPWWALRYDEALSAEPGLEGIAWHSHEMISAGCWALAFALSLIVNARFLVTPHPDGKPG
jgi:uncharacterized protein involved in response to NO